MMLGVLYQGNPWTYVQAGPGVKNSYFMNTYLNNENNIKIEEILASKKDIKIILQSTI